VISNQGFAAEPGMDSLIIPGTERQFVRGVCRLITLSELITDHFPHHVASL